MAMAGAGAIPLRNQTPGPWVNADSTIGEKPTVSTWTIRHVSETPHRKSFMNIFLVARPERVVLDLILLPR
jgi:hypothetical protein